MFTKFDRALLLSEKESPWNFQSSLKNEGALKEDDASALEMNNNTKESGLVEQLHHDNKSCRNNHLCFDLATDEHHKDDNPASKKSANCPSSFFKWLPFPFGSPGPSKSSLDISNQDNEIFQNTINSTCCGLATNVSKKENQMILPSPEQQWMASSDMKPEMAAIMRSVLSDTLDDNSIASNRDKTWAPGKTHPLPLFNYKDAQSSAFRTNTVADQGTTVDKNNKSKRSNKKHRSSSRQVIDNNSLFSRASIRNSISSRTSWNSRLRSSSPSPKVVNIHGKKVTIVDWDLKVLVIDLLSPETCTLVRNMADDHVRKVHENGNRVPTWRTLYTYTKQDLPCSEVENLSSLVTDSITASVKSTVGEIYGKPKEASHLRERSWKEPHLLLYQKLEGKPEHTGVEMHYDGCDITWICMLSSIDEYTGGGTYLRSLQKNIKLQQGQVLVFPGELYHKGCDITSGIRAMIVCFLDGFETNITDPSSPNTDHREWQDNIRIY